MIRWLIVSAIIFTPTAFAVDDKLKDIEVNCIRAYTRLDALLQFFYKFEGNLPILKESKIKNIEYLIAQFEDYKSSTEVKRKAFGDLYNDPDYYHFLLQNKSFKIIKELEELKEKSNPIKDKDLIFSLPKMSSFYEYQNPYLKIKKFVRIQNNIRDLFDVLENSKIRLEQLNQQHLLRKSLDNDPQNLGFIITMNKTSITALIECNLKYLEAERTSK